MKKISTAIIAGVVAFGLTSCDFFFGNHDDSSKNNESSSGVDLTGIPQNWVGLFTFENVTILLKNNLTIKRGDEYRCVGGKWYCKYQGSDVFEEHNGRNIYDIYLTNHSLFSFDQDASCYKALNVTLDDSGYQREIFINVFEGKITNITDTATQNSSVILTTLDFSSYGETTIG